MNIPNCPICKFPLQNQADLRKFQIFSCGECSHRIAIHRQNRMGDYWSVVPSEEHIASLRKTRIRQGEMIVKLLKQHGIATENWIDFGCGPGWFLEVLKKSGANHCAGFDESELSRKHLEKLSIFAIPSQPADPKSPAWDKLPFDPKAISFLDVLEHIPSSELQGSISAALQHFPSISHVLIKVPVSDGILYRTTAAFAKAGVKGPFSQLYQAGSSAPHVHYFSRNSLQKLVQSLGLRILAFGGDPDFENIFDRVPTLRGLPGGSILSRLLKTCEPDSAIVLAQR